jgi:CheY-like chemotaxis protein
MRTTILLADPSPTIRKIVELSLAERSMQLVLARDGREALAEAARVVPDLVIASLGLADCTGYELCRQVKRAAKALPVLLLCETFAPWDEREGLACGADGHLVKPFAPEDLARKVTALLGGATPPVLDADAQRREADLALLDAASALGRPAAASEPSPAPAAAGPVVDPRLALLGPDERASLEAHARSLVAGLCEAIVREAAHEIVPRVAERLVRERLAEIERLVETAAPRRASDET